MTNLMDFPDELLDKIFYECTPRDVVALGQVNKRCREVVTSKYFSDDFWYDNEDDCGCGEPTWYDRRGRFIKDPCAGYHPLRHNNSTHHKKGQSESYKKTRCGHVACRKCLNAMLAGEIKQECPLCSNDWSEFVGKVCLRCLLFDAKPDCDPPDRSILFMFDHCKHLPSLCLSCGIKSYRAKECKLCIDNIIYGRSDAFKA